MDKMPRDGLAYMQYQYAVNNAKSIFALAAVVEGGTNNGNWTGDGQNITDAPRVINALSGAAQVSEVILATPEEMKTAE